MDDASLLEAFEACSLPPGEFRHAAHVRVAWLCLGSGVPFEEAALRFCRGLRRYAAAIGKPDLYHETITWAFLALVNERRHAHPPGTFADFAERNPDLTASGLAALAPLYDAGVLHSTLAREVFLLPRPRV